MGDLITMQFVTEDIKGSPEYRIEDTDGTVVASSHCVNVPANLFTIVVGGKWAGVLPEAKAVAYLQSLVDA